MVQNLWASLSSSLKYEERCGNFSPKGHCTTQVKSNVKDLEKLKYFFLQLNCLYYNLRVEKGRWDKMGENYHFGVFAYFSLRTEKVLNQY